MTYEEAIELAKSKTYNDGPPPDIGWWMTKHKHCPGLTCMRWWDGKRWSYACTEADWGRIDHLANKRSPYAKNEDIKWTDRFWEKRNA